MAKVDIWMPIYIGDYLRDTEELSAEEHGAYVLLLMHYWQKGGNIGADVDRLARVARTNPVTARFILASYFELVEGTYKNKRADIEMAKAGKRRESARENGKKRGNSIPKEQPDTGGLPESEAKSNPRSNSSSSPSSSYIKREREEPQDDFTTRFERIKKTWNDSGLKPIMRKSTFDLMQDERTAIAGTMRNYSDPDIKIAIDNYARLLGSREHRIDNPYQGLIGFIRGGVEKFGPDADPDTAFRIKAPTWKPEKLGALDERPDAVTPEDLAREREDAAAEAMTEEEKAEALKRWTQENADSPMAKALARSAG